MLLLKKNLATLYLRYKDQYQEKYQMEALDHFNDEREDYASQTKAYKELITETGFYIYFLIYRYLELDFFD